MPTAELVAVIIAVLSGLGGLATGIMSKRKIDADAGSTIVMSASKTVNMMEKQLERLQKQIDNLHVLIEALENEIILLGGDPVRVHIELAKGEE